MTSTETRRIAPENDHGSPPMAEGLGAVGWLAFFTLGAIALVLASNF